MRIAILPIIPWNDVITQRPHHLATQFGADGHTVLYVDAHRPIRQRMKPKLVRENVYTHFLQDAQYGLFKRNGDYKHQIQELMKLKADVLIVNAPYWADVAVSLKARTGAFIVYDILDDVFGFEDLVAMGERLHVVHNKLIASADLVTHTAIGLKPERAENTLYVPNACEFEHWNRPRSPGGYPGYFGSTAFWFDKDAIQGLETIHMFGIHSGTAVPYPALPEAAQSWGCGLIPFKRCSLTEHTNPVKFYEYMALGLPVVATDLEEIRYIASAMPESIRPCLMGLDDDWVDAVYHAIKEDTVLCIEERKTWASCQTWEMRYRSMVQHIHT